MKLFLSISSVLGLALFLFGYWGKHSVAGKKRFDEMAGIIPEFSYWLGIGLLAAGLLTSAIWLIRK